jgi:hypothetical protein
MMKIHDEDEYNDTYGRERMHTALTLKKKTEKQILIYLASALSER